MLKVSTLVPMYDNPDSLWKTVMRCDQGFLLQENPAGDMNYNL
jgi:hypothetical protein